MKYSFIGVFLLLMGCAASKLPPAEPTSEMIDQADRIILVTGNSADDSFRTVGQYLTDQGFAINNSDKDLMTIQTGLKSFTSGIVQYSIRVNASVRDSSIHFYGQVGSPMVDEYELDNRGMGGSPHRKAWDKFNEIVSGFPHSQIYYSRN